VGLSIEELKITWYSAFGREYILQQTANANYVGDQTVVKTKIVARYFILHTSVLVVFEILRFYILSV